MHYSNEIVTDVRERNDIVSVVSSYVSLRQRGSSFFGLCPFHKEKSPSFSVNPEKQIFYCFGCGVGGNVITFIMRIENYGFLDALKHLADRVAYVLPQSADSSQDKQLNRLKERVYSININAARFFHDKLMADTGQAARDYISSRRIDRRTIIRFGLGYSPDGSELYKHLKNRGFDDFELENSGLVLKSKSGLYYDKFRKRLIFPIIDPLGKVVAFGGRIIGSGEPKYLNSPDTPVFSKSKVLFGLNFARKTKSGDIIIVEGYMDVLAIFQAGFENVSAALGTAFNREHVKTLNQYMRGKSVLLLFDSDEAGQKAALRAASVLKKNGSTSKILQLDNAKDPDEFIAKFGSSKFKEVLDGAVNLTVFQLSLIKRKYDLNNTNGKINFLNEAAVIISSLDNYIEQDAYISELSKETGISYDALKNQVLKLSSPPVQFAAPQYRNKSDLVSDFPKSILDACRNVLYCLAEHINLYQSLKDSISGEELLHPVYIRLYEEICNTHSLSKSFNLPDIISRFESLSEQDAVAAVFAAPLPYQNDNLLKIALNQQIKIIKAANISRKIEQAKIDNNFKLIHELGKIQRNLPDSYI